MCMYITYYLCCCVRVGLWYSPAKTVNVKVPKVRILPATLITVYFCGNITHENLCRTVGNDSRIFWQRGRIGKCSRLEPGESERTCGIDTYRCRLKMSKRI